MAIIKDFETPQGVSAAYHKIIKAEILPNELVIRVVVAVYASAAARDAGKSVLWHEYVDIPFSALTQDPRDLLYPMVAAYGSSYLRAGLPDIEGSGAPGNFEINLTPEALVPPTPILHPVGPTPTEAAIIDMGPQLPVEFNPVQSPLPRETTQLPDGTWVYVDTGLPIEPVPVVGP